MTFPNHPHRLAGRVEQSGQPHSPFRPKAGPGLSVSTLHVCSSASWVLQESTIWCTGQGGGNGNPSRGWGSNLLTFSSVGGKMHHSVSPLCYCDWFPFPKDISSYSRTGRRESLLTVFMCFFWYTGRLDHVKQGCSILQSGQYLYVLSSQYFFVGKEIMQHTFSSLAVSFLQTAWKPFPSK